MYKFDVKDDEMEDRLNEIIDKNNVDIYGFN